MHTRDIQRDQWGAFLDQFTRLHRGEALEVETIPAGAPPSAAVLCDQPLVGVVAVQQCDRGTDCIEVIAGAEPLTQSHTIHEPAHLSATETDDGRPTSLQITADDGSVTLLRFEPENRSPVPPANFLG